MHNTARQRLVQADTNYGVVTDNTVRTAAQIGNATGPADFGDGPTTSQTIRVVLANDTTLAGPFNFGVNTFDDRPNVPLTTETQVVAYVPSSDYYLKRASVQGCCDALFTIKIDGIKISQKRNNWTERNCDFDFGSNGLHVAAGKTVEITVVNEGQTAGPFSGNIYGEEP